MLTRTHRRRPFIQIVSLLDVFTILLFYFMLFTTFRTTPAGVNVNLPKATNASTTAIKEMVVTVDADGRLYADGRRTDAQSLTATTRNYVEQNPDIAVTIRADESTKYENVVAAIDAVRAGGANRLRLAVELTSGDLH